MISQRSRDIHLFHQQLGHPHEQITIATAKAFGINLTRKFLKCEDCALDKVYQKNVKVSNKTAENSGRCLCLDIFSTENPGVRCKHYLLLFFR